MSPFEPVLAQSTEWYARGYRDAANPSRAYSRDLARLLAKAGKGDRASYNLGYAHGAAWRRKRDAA